jgi:Uma2 family endonuclease
VRLAQRAVLLGVRCSARSEINGARAQRSSSPLRRECYARRSMTAARSIRNSADVEAMRERAPTGMRSEIIHGALLMAPAPRASHQFAIGRLLAALDRALPLRRGGSGPTGWLFLLGPELHLGEGPDKLNPDIAAWRAERAPSLDDYPIEVVPDWLCEVLSPSTEVYDRATKLPLFAAYGARHAWLLDPDARTLEVFALDSAGARQIARFDGDDIVCAAPLDEVPIELATLWG